MCVTVQCQVMVIYLDPGNYPSLFDQINEGSSIIRLLVEGLVEENHPADRLDPRLVAGEEKLPVFPPVLLGVLQSALSQPLAHRTSGLVSSQDAFTRGNNSLGYFLQLLLELHRGVVEVGSHLKLSYDHCGTGVS